MRWFPIASLIEAGMDRHGYVFGYSSVFTGDVEKPGSLPAPSVYILVKISEPDSLGIRETL
jgi:hypothetical protein